MAVAHEAGRQPQASRLEHDGVNAVVDEVVADAQRVQGTGGARIRPGHGDAAVGGEPQSELDVVQLLPGPHVDAQRRRPTVTDEGQRGAVVVQDLHPRHTALAGTLVHLVLVVLGELAGLLGALARLLLIDRGEVGGDDLVGGADHLDAPVIEPHDLIAHLGGQGQRVGHQRDRRPPVPQLAHEVEALALELLVADGDDLIDDEDRGLDGDRRGEAEAHGHARGVDLDRLIDEVADVREFDDPVERLVDLPPRPAEDRAVEVDILPARELAVEARPHLQQRIDLARDRDLALRGPVHAGQDLEHGRLTRPVVSDEAEGRALPDPEADVVQGAEHVRVPGGAAHEPLLERVPPVRVHGEGLGHVLHLDGVLVVIEVRDGLAAGTHRVKSSLPDPLPTGGTPTRPPRRPRATRRSTPASRPGPRAAGSRPMSGTTR